jgi:tripartite-type tricarboxylate transporter receptor subunit TctC
MFVRSVFAIVIAIVSASVASAQDYPSKPVRLVVGFTAGGIADLGARLLADYITRQTGQVVIVENRATAAGTIAAQAVAKAPPDGYTLGVVLNGQLAINPFVQKAFPFDALKDLVPVAAIGEAPQMIAINSAVPAKTLKEFVALARAKPGSMSYASAGFGSLPHLSAAEFVRMAGIDLVHVPYKGNQPATADLLGGQVHLLSSSIGGLRAGLDAGRIRLLLTATKERLAITPDVPTSAEAGIPGYLMTVWAGLVAPAGTPKPVVGRLHALVQGMLKEETTLKRMAGAALEPMRMSQPDFSAFVQDEYVKWQKIVKDAGVEPQ